MKEIVFLSLTAALLTACAGDKGSEDHFLEACEHSDQCPVAWTCSDPADVLVGAVYEVCTPACVRDDFCTEVLDRDDVYCYGGGFCVIACSSHDDCPEELPYCRGSDPSCSGEDLVPWCAKEDHVCE
jgi:hypothetical protein